MIFFVFEYLEIMGICSHFVLVFERKSKINYVDAKSLKLPENIYHVLKDYQDPEKVGLRYMYHFAGRL